MASAQQSAERIYTLLTEALSEDPVRRRAAEQALRQAEDEIDFFASLAQIATAADEHAEPTVRWLAAVCGKNAVPRSWRRRVHQNAVTEDERSFVIHTLLSSIGEKRANIATQLSVWIAAIGRLDFPRHWRSVVSDLCNQVKPGNVITMKHALSTLDMTLKGLESVRLRTDRLVLQLYGPSAFSMIYGVFRDRISEIPSICNDCGQQEAQDKFQILVFCLKSLRRIIDNACGDLAQLASLPELFQLFVGQREYFMCARKSGTDIQRRLSLLAVKLVRVTHCRHPITFQPYLSVFLPLYYQMVMSYETNSYDERICFHAVNFLMNLLNSPDYRYDGTNVRTIRENHNASFQIPPGNSPEGCRAVILSFFSEDAMKKLFEVIISKIFILTAEEVETWASDPEALVRKDDEEYWGLTTLRKECELLMTLLLCRDAEHLVDHILKLTWSVPHEQALLLDACYRAVGIVGATVRGNSEFDVDSALKGRVGTILQSKCGENLGERIIQARAVWLIGQCTEQLSRESRRMLYPWLVRLMAERDYDRVIVLTAAKTVQFLVDDLGFHGEDFAGYLEACIEACVRLVRESESVETKRELMGTVCNLISGCGPEVVAPVSRAITLSIPLIWEDFGRTGRGSSAGGGNSFDERANSGNVEVLLQMDVVILLRKLIQKTGDVLLRQSDTLQVLTAVLQYSLDASRGAGNIAMVPDACELWLTVVMGSKEYMTELHQLFPMTEKVLGNDHDNLGIVFQIMKEYMLLGGGLFLKDFHGQISHMVHTAIKSVVDRGLLAAADVTDMWLQVYSSDGLETFGQVLRLMMEKIEDQSESMVVSSAFLAVLGRATLINVEKVGSIVFQNDEKTCLALVDGIIGHLDTLPRLKGRRIGVLGLCMLVSRYRESSEVRRRVSGVLNGVAHVLGEEGKLESRREQIRKRADFEYDISRNGDREVGHIPFRAEANATLDGEVRQKQMQERDVGKVMRIEDACKQMLVSIHSLGEEAYAEALRGTDPAITQQIEGIL